MNFFSISQKQSKIIFVLILLIFVTFATASNLTYRPEVDEGMFASPAINLANRRTFRHNCFGHFGNKLNPYRTKNLLGYAAFSDKRCGIF